MRPDPAEVERRIRAALQATAEAIAVGPLPAPRPADEVGPVIELVTATSPTRHGRRGWGLALSVVAAACVAGALLVVALLGGSRSHSVQPGSGGSSPANQACYAYSPMTVTVARSHFVCSPVPTPVSSGLLSGSAPPTSAPPSGSNSPFYSAPAGSSSSGS